VSAQGTSAEYLRLINKAFRDWSAAESEEKRKLIRNLLSNVAATRICSDDVISMFITWIEKYSESHFAVIREVFKHPGVTRHEVWNAIHGHRYGKTPRKHHSQNHLIVR
jgi:hypothetical protein